MISMSRNDGFFSVIAIVILAASYLVLEAEGASLSKQCHYSGYVPGGAINKVGRTSVVKPAAFEENMLQTALGYFNDGSGVSAATLGVIDSVGDVLKVSPQLSAALGILTVGLGFLKNDPSPQDILDKAMSSVKLLSDEVNTMMDEMTDYVDAKDLEVERIVMDNHYNEIFDRWVNCAREITAEKANTCQQRAQNKISSARFHFQPFDELFEEKNTNENRPLYTPDFSYRASAGTWQWMKENCGYDKHARAECLSHEQVKRLEIGIIPFRDYASLHLLVLKTLEATYKSKSNRDRVACGYYKRYLSTIASKADYYIRYAKWAYEWTYIRLVMIVWIVPQSNAFQTKNFQS